MSPLPGRNVEPILSIPEEIILATRYAYTFKLIHQGKLKEAYRELFKYKERTYLNIYGSPLRPHRPYYYYSDEDRYLWFEFLQSELRSSGYNYFADSILETEIEHFRELIVWQLQLRAYLVLKLHEYGDNFNLLTLKDILVTEYTELKSDSSLQPNFERALEILYDMEDKVKTTFPIDSYNGILVLPWIDRDAIDRKQGIESGVLSLSPSPITWNTTPESIDDETKEEMKDSYERSIHCIRALAVVSERLYLERDLRTMVQLHSRLACNININCTPTGVSNQDFSDIKDKYGDGGNFLELDQQTKLDLRRYDLIANDFWGHQARRRNGDMSVGDLVLPWVEIPKE
jgi:hypothetical protein